MPSLGGKNGGLLVFDKDGVLQDFAHRWQAVTRARAAALVSAVPAAGPVAACEALLGLAADGSVLPGGLLACGSRQESLVALATRCHLAGLPWPAARTAAQVAFVAADADVDFDASTRPPPGVPEALHRLADAGWSLALATTDQTEDARRFLAGAGVLERFTAVVGVDRVTAGKPDPAMFLLACQEAGVPPAEALMVGDLDVDLRMGRAAGAAATIGVLAGIGDAPLLAPWADLLVPDVPALVGLA